MELVSVTDNPFGLYFIFYFHFIVTPPLVESPVVSLLHTSSDVAKRGGVVGTYSPYRFPYVIVRKRTVSQTSTYNKLIELINT